MPKDLKKPVNAYLQYRNDVIKPGFTMSQHSKITGQKWKNITSLDRRKYYHTAAKDAIKKEAGNGLTDKTFYQDGGKFAFIIETPKNTKEERIFEKYTQNTDYIGV